MIVGLFQLHIPPATDMIVGLFQLHIPPATDMIVGLFQLHIPPATDMIVGLFQLHIPPATDSTCIYSYCCEHWNLLRSQVARWSCSRERCWSSFYSVKKCMYTLSE
eukprot:scpid103099/ scgid24581/ 